MNKVFALAGAIALSIIPTPSFSGEVEQKEIMSVTEQLLPQIGEKYNNLDIKEKKAYKESLINYLENVQKTGATGVGEAFEHNCVGSAASFWHNHDSTYAHSHAHSIAITTRGNSNHAHKSSRPHPHNHWCS